LLIDMDFTGPTRGNSDPATIRRRPTMFALPSLCFHSGTAVQAPNARHEMILLPPRNSETADRIQPP
jgi:hypothetical protein